jgi:uncharacterized membrane protein
MPKQLLTGTLEDQCDFLYDLAKQKMAQGNYTGALHALKEIADHAPDYKDVPVLLAQAHQRKREQTMLVVTSLIGLAVFVGVGSLVGVLNDLLLLLLAMLGAVVGFFVGNAFIIYRQRKLVQNPVSTGDR